MYIQKQKHLFNIILPTLCNMIRFSKKIRNILFDYTLEGSKLDFLDKIKYLGARITSVLNWK